VTIQVKRKAVVVPRTGELVGELALELRLQASIIEETIRQQQEGREIGPLDPNYWKDVAKKSREAAEALEDLI
jgi:hypothetical protein